MIRWERDYFANPDGKMGSDNTSGWTSSQSITALACPRLPTTNRVSEGRKACAQRSPYAVSHGGSIRESCERSRDDSDLEKYERTDRDHDANELFLNGPRRGCVPVARHSRKADSEFDSAGFQ